MSQTTDDSRITRVVTDVAHFIDGKQWSALRELYAESVTTDYTSLFGGEVQTQRGDDLIATWRKLLTPVVTQHMLGPITVDVSGNAATARCHVRGYHYRAGETWMVAGHYVFRLAKAGERWTIEAMTLETLYQSGNAGVLDAGAGEA